MTSIAIWLTFGDKVLLLYSSFLWTIKKKKKKTNTVVTEDIRLPQKTKINKHNYIGTVTVKISSASAHTTGSTGL